MAERSATWWVDRLNKQLDDRQKTIATLNRYYEGDHPLSEIPPRVPDAARQAFRRWMRQNRANWMGLVVESVAERLEVQGVRYGDDQAADQGAWDIWQANGMDVGSEMVFTDALVTGESYMTVEPNPADESRPFIWPEHPSQVIVSCDPARPSVRRASFKKWLDDSGFVFAVLQLPDVVVRLCSERTVKQGDTSKIRWVPRGDDAEFRNPFGAVSVVPFRNRARLLGGGRSEIADVLDTQDRINRTIFLRMIAAEYAAFRQRAASGLPLEVDDDGKAKMPFTPSMVELWVSENPETKWHEFSATDLTPYIQAVESDIQHIAAETKTPPQYLLGAMVNISGDALKAAESGLVSKVRRRARHFGESIEEVFRLAFLAAGDEAKAKVVDAEVIWRNPEFRTEGELVDALVKMKTLGVPDEALQERWGASPQEIARWRAMKAADGLLAGDDEATARRLSVAEAVQKVYLGVGKVITSDEARAIVNELGGDLPVPGPEFTPDVVPSGDFG